MTPVPQSTMTPVDNVTIASGELSPPDYMYAYVTIFNALIFFVGVVGNVMVVHVIVRMRALRSRVNYFLASLSVADLLVLIVCQPAAMLVFYTRDRWILGRFMCKLVPFLEHWTLYSSVLTLLAIGVDRYFTICRPLSEQATICPSNTCFLIVPLWVIASLIALPFVFLTELEGGEYLDGTAVELCRTRISGLLPRLFVAMSFLLMFLVPLILLTFLYVSVIHTLRMLSRSKDEVRSGAGVNMVSRGHRVHPATAKSRRQVSRMMAAIVVLFFVSFLPFKILTMSITFGQSDNIQKLGYESYYNLLSISRLVTYINSAGNPMIYAWMSPRFRRAFRLSLPRSRCKSESPKRGSFVERQRRPPERALKLDTPQVVL